MSRQRGSAIIWVFVVIALFGALTFMMSKGSRTGSSNIDREKNSLTANEIINYGRTIKSAVQELRIHGCADTELSFDYGSGVSGYENTSAPSDNSCHIFDPSGGGLRWGNFSDLGLTYLRINGRNRVEDLGTDCNQDTCADLILFMDGVSQDLCLSINQKLGIGDSVNTNGVNVAINVKFSTAAKYVSSSERIDASNVTRKLNGCYQSNGAGGNRYVYFQVLLAR